MTGGLEASRWADDDPDPLAWVSLGRAVDMAAGWIMGVGTRRPARAAARSPFEQDLHSAGQASGDAARWIVNQALSTVLPAEQSVRGQLRGMGLLYRSAGPRLIDPSCLVLARSAWEGSVRLLWMLDPHTPAHTRLARMARHVLDGEENYTRAFAGIGGEELTRALEETRTKIKEAAVVPAPSLNLSDDAAEYTLDDGGTYRRLSGIAHSRGGMLMNSVLATPEEDGARYRWNGYHLLQHHISLAPLLDAAFQATAAVGEYWTGVLRPYETELTAARRTAQTARRPDAGR